MFFTILSYKNFNLIQTMKRLEIAEYLLQNGFIEDGDTFTQIGQQQTGEMIVNGHRQIQVQNVEIKITFIGNGWYRPRRFYC